jgi:hypothetical protein
MRGGGGEGCRHAHLDYATLVARGKHAVGVEIEGQSRGLEGVAQHREYLLKFRALFKVVQRVYAVVCTLQVQTE